MTVINAGQVSVESVPAVSVHIARLATVKQVYIVNNIVRQFVTFGLKFDKIREFYKKITIRKIRLAILGLWAHSTGCSGAVPSLINTRQRMNLGQ